MASWQPCCVISTCGKRGSSHQRFRAGFLVGEVFERGSFLKFLALLRHDGSIQIQCMTPFLSVNISSALPTRSKDSILKVLPDISLIASWSDRGNPLGSQAGIFVTVTASPFLKRRDGRGVRRLLAAIFNFQRICTERASAAFRARAWHCASLVCSLLRNCRLLLRRTRTSYRPA